MNTEVTMNAGTIRGPRMTAGEVSALLRWEGASDDQYATAVTALRQQNSAIGNAANLGDALGALQAFQGGTGQMNTGPDSQLADALAAQRRNFMRDLEAQAIRGSFTGTSMHPISWDTLSPQINDSYFGGGGAISARKIRKPLATSRVFALIKRALGRLDGAALGATVKSGAALAAQAKQNGQAALYEELSKRVVEASHELALAEAGFGTYLKSSSVHAFRMRSEKEMNITPVENFGRQIPAPAAQKLKQARATGLFKAFTVLHAGKAFIKTTADAIREKDPILFGITERHPDRLYFIADWVDEFCDLTLGQLLVNEAFAGSLESVEVDRAKLEAEVNERDRLMRTTAPSTWRANEEAARKLNSESKPWWRIW